MGKRSINDILDHLILHDEMEVARLWDALREAREVLRAQLSLNPKHIGDQHQLLLKKWDEHG